MTRRGRHGPWRTLLPICLLVWLGASRAGAIGIAFDYRFDASGFFADPGTRAALEHAGGLVGQALGDDLAAIVPTGTDLWSALLVDPATGDPTAVPGLVVDADSVTLFVGARDLGGDILANATPGSFSVMGSRDWFDTIRLRGQSGADDVPASDYGPWGGAIAFDADSPWGFGIETSSLGGGQYDFVTAAVHEIFHVLGFGLADSWRDQVSLGAFDGAEAAAAFGAAVPLSADLEHWAEGTTGLVGGLPQEALMDPTLATGERKLPTDLDWAGLADVGWRLVPEPATGALAALGLAALALLRRTRRSPAT